MEAELVAARIAACFSIFIKSESAYDKAYGRKSDTENDKFIEELEPGMIEYLNPGEDISSFNPNRPGQQFDTFVEKTLRFIGAGLNIPYEIVLKDFSKTNFSSARAAILEAQKFFRSQQKFIAQRLCYPCWLWLADERFLRGEIAVADYFERRLDYTKVKWIPPGWGYVDPEKEIAASKEAIDNNVSTLAEECAAHGRDWEEVLKQRAREEELRRKLGLPETVKNQKGMTSQDNRQERNKDEED
jgi:lambda family phage portal protein